MTLISCVSLESILDPSAPDWWYAILVMLYQLALAACGLS